LTTIGAPISHVSQRRFHFGEGAVRPGGHAGRVEDVLAKRLAAFELRGGFGRAENLQAGRGEFIDDALDQRRFGADDGQIDFFVGREFEQRVDVLRADGQVDGAGFGARVAGRAKNGIHQRRLADFPGQSMFASAAADNQHFHHSLLTACPRKQEW